jgi:glutamate/tyrosine decarboxylase-like PLP-dependent enzyme
MRELKESDAAWREGRTWSLIYPAGEDVDSLLREANLLYLYENALNPFRFPSLRSMEVDVVAMTAQLLHGGDSAAGAMTSGGTESIIMAAKTARDRARQERGVTRPQMVVPYSAHPAFAKACSYLGIEQIPVPLGNDQRADVDAAADLVTDQTVLIAGSAPCYPFGVIDPIEDLAAIAAERDINFHTDSCLGGFVLPFFEKLGVAVPPFDFRVPGVTTISADVHKYGYCTKGASVIAHRTQRSLHEYQLFKYSDWPGGGYASFAMAGARPAAPIAAAWAVLHYLGEEGYLRLAQVLLDTTQRLREGIAAIPGLQIIGNPEMTLFAFGADPDHALDIFAVGDAMDERGWCLDRQQDPDALHLMVSPEHARVVDAFLADLREATKTRDPSRGTKARYA